MAEGSAGSGELLEETSANCDGQALVPERKVESDSDERDLGVRNLGKPALRGVFERVEKAWRARRLRMPRRLSLILSCEGGEASDYGPSARHCFTSALAPQHRAIPSSVAFPLFLDCLSSALRPSSMDFLLALGRGRFRPTPRKYGGTSFASPALKDTLTSRSASLTATRFKEMSKLPSFLCFLLFLARGAVGADVPAAVQALYDSAKGGTTACTHQLDTNPAGYESNGA